MLVSKTPTKKKDSPNNIENPFLVSYRFLQDVPQKQYKSFFRCNRLLHLVFRFCISSPTNCDKTVELLDIHSKTPRGISSSSASRSGYKWLNIPKACLFMFIGSTHMFRHLRRHLLLHLIVCKTIRVPKTQWDSRRLESTGLGRCEHPLTR